MVIFWSFFEVIILVYINDLFFWPMSFCTDDDDDDEISRQKQENYFFRDLLFVVAHVDVVFVFAVVNVGVVFVVAITNVVIVVINHLIDPIEY